MSKVMEKNNKSLFKFCMEGKWDQVKEIYKEDKKAHEAIITRAGDTALHVAVTDGQEHVVSQLVKLLEQEQTKNALKIQNKRGNTALHFAASMGTMRMIEDIANADRSLVSVRNVDGETPLFLAAFHGRKEEFKTLHNICHMELQPGVPIPINYSNCRRNDGDTILHCAIAADNFDLAFQIIHRYEDLVNRVNEKGDYPLHILANKPSAFKSGSRLGRFETFIYYGILVEELKEDPNFLKQSNEQGNDKNSYPENYQTCVDLMMMVKKAGSVVTNKFPLTHYLIKKCGQKNQDQDQAQAQAQAQAQRGDPEAQRNTAAIGVETNSSGSSEAKGKDKNSYPGNYQSCVDLMMVVKNAASVCMQNEGSSEAKAWSHPFCPKNYKSCADFFKFVFVVMLVILGRGTSVFKKIHRKKEKHVWSVQIMDELLKRASMYENDDNGGKPQLDSRDKARDNKETSPYAVYEGGNNTSDLDGITEDQQTSSTTGETNQQNRADKKDEKSENVKEKETPILTAAKNGVIEMVERILELYPVAVHDMDANKKNIVLLAVENRQPHLYALLLKKKARKESLFRKVDNEANSALHLAAKLGGYKPWLIPGAALQMYWEIKWYYYVKESMSPRFFGRYNKSSKTPREVFAETHKELVKSGGEWLKQTSESCSVVAALIATVAFATSTTVPGGVKEDTGIPTLENTAAFKVFAISSLLALCCSVTAVVLFLSILTSRYQENDFGKNLPRKLILGLTSIFMSITSMLVSFCAGHFLVLRNKLKDAALPIYAATCLPVTLFALAQFPLYIDLIWATFQKVPQRSFKPGSRL